MAASTLKGKSSDDEVLKIYKSKNIVVRFLNIVDGKDNDGLEFKYSKYGVGALQLRDAER